MSTTKKDLEHLSLLGHNAKPSKNLEVFPNHDPHRPYTVTLRTDEFSCLCPATGQPDFATITVRYIPDKWIVESKSLKLYFWSYRNEGVFHEHVTNTICDDLVKALDPRWLEVTGAFKVRGGIDITVVATHEKKKPRASAAPRKRAKRVAKG